MPWTRTQMDMYNRCFSQGNAGMRLMGVVLYHCPAQALAVDDMADIKDSVDDYLDRNQDAFDEFDNPDDVYYDLIEQLDSLEVGIS